MLLETDVFFVIVDFKNINCNFKKFQSKFFLSFVDG